MLDQDVCEISSDWVREQTEEVSDDSVIKLTMHFMKKIQDGMNRIIYQGDLNGTPLYVLTSEILKKILNSHQRLLLSGTLVWLP